MCLLFATSYVMKMNYRNWKQKVSWQRRAQKSIVLWCIFFMKKRRCVKWFYDIFFWIFNERWVNRACLYFIFLYFFLKGSFFAINRETFLFWSVIIVQLMMTIKWRRKLNNFETERKAKVQENVSVLIGFRKHCDCTGIVWLKWKCVTKIVCRDNFNELSIFFSTPTIVLTHSIRTIGKIVFFFIFCKWHYWMHFSN